jgi:hypothetical protein
VVTLTAVCDIGPNCAEAAVKEVVSDSDFEKTSMPSFGQEDLGPILKRHVTRSVGQIAYWTNHLQACEEE